MARNLDWSRHQYRNKITDSMEQRARGAQYFNDRDSFLKAGIMTAGKYRGTKLGNIPLNYLCWASETLDNNNLIKTQADNELRHRYRQLLQTEQKVSGPDSNTAVKKAT